MVASENKVTFGLKNTHYAVITDDGNKITYGTPAALPGATELTLDASGDAVEFSADDTKYYSADNNQGYTGKLTIAKLTEAFEKEVLGIDDSKGVSTENANAKMKRIALMFEFDGDQKAVRHLLFNVSLSRPGDGSKTKEDKVDVNTQELEFTAAPDPYSGDVKTKTNSTTTEEVYNAWYDAVFTGTSAPVVG
ncbi:MAG: phage tail protein [Leuconostoc mesenteroides]|jgi:phi13 family phage major tail protein|nr:phage tail protein [Leuconostoc mesenteroides]MCI1878490.1 phage tail protein [Leuconostoc mesenteroides]MCI1908031.1 phage tail protein [Leuconostoc mesenteroides]